MKDPTSEPRRASTVVLLRERGEGLQVYLLERSTRSGFFPGSYVFPGGAVDPSDKDATFWSRHVDLDRSGTESRFGSDLSAEEAMAHAIAAIRETFEEAGVLLATSREGKGFHVAALCESRAARPFEKGWLREWAASGDGILSLSSLVGWSHWITPEAFRPRFDTRFFVAFMPEGQACAPDTRETTSGVWIEPAGALHRNLQGTLPLSPPTLVTLQEILPFRGIKDVPDPSPASSWEMPRLPRLIRLPRGAMILEPWDPMIHDEIRVDEEKLQDLVLPVGTPFSRIWLQEGIWRPVGVQE